jgi:glutamate 5-kinase
MARISKNRSRIWIVKIGSQLLIDGGPLLIRSLMNDTAELQKNHGIKVVWVSSGAIASARKRLGRLEKSAKNKQANARKTLPEKQALSAIGQPMLMDLYNVALQSQGLIGSQVLLSYTDFRFKENRRNFTNTILKLLDWNAVPILNENDAVATDEIQFGDNDQLSAMIAGELKAERLVILTNVEGLYNKSPEFPDAELISFLPEINHKVLQMADGSKSKMGKGGMVSKLLAAQNAWKKKVPTTIAKGEISKVLIRLALGESIGTSIGILL